MSSANGTASSSSSTKSGNDDKESDNAPLGVMGSLAKYNIDQEFARAFALVNVSIEQLTTDTGMEVIYDKLQSPTDHVVVCRKLHSSGLYTYHFTGILPV